MREIYRRSIRIVDLMSVSSRTLGYCTRRPFQQQNIHDSLSAILPSAAHPLARCLHSLKQGLVARTSDTNVNMNDHASSDGASTSDAFSSSCASVSPNLDLQAATSQANQRHPRVSRRSACFRQWPSCNARSEQSKIPSCFTRASEPDNGVTGLGSAHPVTKQWTAMAA